MSSFSADPPNARQPTGGQGLVLTPRGKVPVGVYGSGSATSGQPLLADGIGNATFGGRAIVAAYGLTVLNATAIASHQNPSYVTAAGSTMFSVDQYGNVTAGPNELLDKTAGANLVLADFFVSAAERRTYSRSFIATEVNDPVDMALGRLGAPTTLLAADVSLPAATIYVAYIGTGFLAAGTFVVGNDTVTYTGFSVAASTTVSGTQTINRDSTVTLNVVSTTGLQAVGVCRVGEQYVRYTAVTSTTLVNAQLIKCGATTSYSATNGQTVSQHKFTGCTGGVGSPTATDSVEQNNYPVPPTAAGLTGVRGDGVNLGRMHWRAARSPDGAPAGGDSTPGLADISAHVYAISAEAARPGKVGGNLVFGTTPLQAGDPLDNMEITYDGSIRLGTSATIGPNRLNRPSIAKLDVVNATTGWNGLAVRRASGQTAKIIEIMNESSVSLAGVDKDGFATGGLRSLDQITLDALGWGSWTFSIMLAGNGSAVTSQTIFFTTIPLRKGQTVTNLIVNVVQAAAGAAPTTVQLALLDTAGTRLGVTGNLASDGKLTSTGHKAFALGTPYPVTTDGLYVAAVLQDGAFASTVLQLGRSSQSNAIAINSILPYGTAGTGQTGIGATVTYAAGTPSFWFATS